jgi:hypothetical protein
MDADCNSQRNSGGIAELLRGEDGKVKRARTAQSQRVLALSRSEMPETALEYCGASIGQ